MVDLDRDVITFETTLNVQEFIRLTHAVNNTRYCSTCRVIVASRGRSICVECTKYLRWMVKIYYLIKHMCIEDVSSHIYSLYALTQLGIECKK